MLRSEIKVVRDSLPNTANGIADLMRKEKMVGFRGEADTCPLANYFARYFPDAEKVSVYDNIWISRNSWVDCRVSSTEAMKKFINLFDDCAYPDLIADFDPQSLTQRPVYGAEISTDEISA